MKELDIDEVETNLMIATSLSAEKRRKLVNWYNKQNVLIHLDIFKEQKNQYFKLKSGVNEDYILSIASFYLAVNKYHVLEEDFKKKNNSNSLDKMARYSDLIIKQSAKQRKKPKLELLRNMWSVVETYKKNNASFRTISKNLYDYYEFEISHSAIQKEWKRLDNGN